MFNPEDILNNTFDEEYTQFYDCIKDILELDEIMALSTYDQHVGTSRLDHSLYVAYYAYKWAKSINADFKSSARGGLLHDLFHYNWWEDNHLEGKHAWTHPKIALRNAKEVVLLNKIECDCIVKHMWPLSLSMPRYKESYLVTFADKYSATVEVFLGLRRVLSHRKQTVVLNTVNINKD